LNRLQSARQRDEEGREASRRPSLAARARDDGNPSRRDPRPASERIPQRVVLAGLDRGEATGRDVCIRANAQVRAVDMAVTRSPARVVPREPLGKTGRVLCPVVDGDRARDRLRTGACEPELLLEPVAGHARVGVGRRDPDPIAWRGEAFEQVARTECTSAADVARSARDRVDTGAPRDLFAVVAACIEDDHELASDRGRQRRERVLDRREARGQQLGFVVHRHEHTDGLDHAVLS